MEIYEWLEQFKAQWAGQWKELLEKFQGEELVAAANKLWTKYTEEFMQQLVRRTEKEKEVGLPHDVDGLLRAVDRWLEMHKKHMEQVRKLAELQKDDQTVKQ